MFNTHAKCEADKLNSWQDISSTYRRTDVCEISRLISDGKSQGDEILRPIQMYVYFSFKEWIHGALIWKPLKQKHLRWVWTHRISVIVSVCREVKKKNVHLHDDHLQDWAAGSEGRGSPFTCILEEQVAQSKMLKRKQCAQTHSWWWTPADVMRWDGGLWHWGEKVWCMKDYTLGGKNSLCGKEKTVVLISWTASACQNRWQWRGEGGGVSNMQVRTPHHHHHQTPPPPPNQLPQCERNK